MSSYIFEKTVADFFAGIGLVTMGLNQAGWKTTYALDYDKVKELQYSANFGKGHYKVMDISNEKGIDVPNVTLAHASFPCTDLSLAGSKKGIHQGESSTFWEFARIILEMQSTYGKSNPPLILLENVEGLLITNKGMDLHAVLTKLNTLGYKVDLLRINASHFVPQSRVRIFVIGINKYLHLTSDSRENLHSSNARPKRIIEFIEKNTDIDWYFHNLPNLPERSTTVDDIVDHRAEWWSDERKQSLLSQMHGHQRELVEKAMQSNHFHYYPAFRRTRIREGKKQSTLELRTDGIVGCLRTPKGGSSRQIIVRAGKGKLDARLINGIEAARLMGADDFVIESSLTLNQVLFGFGDAVCVPVLTWIGNYYLNQVLISTFSENYVDLQLDSSYQLPIFNIQN